MKVTLADALGIRRSSDEIDLLSRRIEALNKKMMELVNEAVASGKSVNESEGEFQEISSEIKQLTGRIESIKNTACEDNSQDARIKKMEKKVDEYSGGIEEYDDSIVRQMIECVRVYESGKLDIIFGGGITEYLIA